MRTTQKTPELCAVCGGALNATTITHEEKRGTTIYLFTNTPSQVCAVCGELWIDEETFQEIDRLILEGKPTRKVETPVYDLARTK